MWVKVILDDKVKRISLPKTLVEFKTKLYKHYRRLKLSQQRTNINEELFNKL